MHLSITHCLCLLVCFQFVLSQYTHYGERLQSRRNEDGERNKKDLEEARRPDHSHLHPCSSDACACRSHQFRIPERSVRRRSHSNPTRCPRQAYQTSIPHIKCGCIGVSIIDDRQHNVFPTPLDATDMDDVYVGRIRRDISLPNGNSLDIFLCGDQIRKGAALNAVQIAELLLWGARLKRRENLVGL